MRSSLLRLLTGNPRARVTIPRDASETKKQTRNRKRRWGSLAISRLFKRAAGLSGASEAIFSDFPIHHIPPRVNVIRTTVLILQVIRVLPHIQSDHGKCAFHKRRILIGGGDDFELVRALHQPHPAGAETTGAGGGELFLELIEAAEGALDRV